jgi:hypothetical protein
MGKLYNIYKSTIVYDYMLHRHIIYLQVLPNNVPGLIIGYRPLDTFPSKLVRF